MLCSKEKHNLENLYNLEMLTSRDLLLMDYNYVGTITRTMSEDRRQYFVWLVFIKNDAATKMFINELINIGLIEPCASRKIIMDNKFIQNR